MKRVESSKPKKQRKFHYNMPLHKKQQLLASHLDKKLRKELGTRSIALRKGDVVKILRGKKKGSSGKIIDVNYNKGTVFIEKIVRKKANGEEIPMPLQASNLLVTDLDSSDARRFKGKKMPEKKEEEKPAEEKEAAKAKAGKKEEKAEKGKKIPKKGKRVK